MFCIPAEGQLAEDCSFDWKFVNNTDDYLEFELNFKNITQVSNADGLDILELNFWGAGLLNDTKGK
jgi:hypothetical protein